MCRTINIIYDYHRHIFVPVFHTLPSENCNENDSSINALDENVFSEMTLYNGMSSFFFILLAIITITVPKQTDTCTMPSLYGDWLTGLQ